MAKATAIGSTREPWPRPAEVPDGVAGLFGPHTVSWRVLRENVLSAFGGARALILQVGHPLVGAGVSAHSDYRTDPWGRLFRTLDATTAIVFGTPREAEAAARRVWHVHGKVRGELSEDGGPFAAGTRYSARDPELALWVHATLVDTALLVYDRYVAPLSHAERETYYEEQKLFAEMFGVPRELQPATYADFRVYFDRMVAEELALTDSLADVYDATLVHPALPLPARPLRVPATELLKLHTTAMLPGRLRDVLELAWGPGRERLVRASEPLVRRMLPLLPGVLRDYPRARAARTRLRTA